MKKESFLQKMELHIHNEVRQKCKFEDSLFSSSGNIIFKNQNSVHQFIFQFNNAVKQGLFGKNQKQLSAAELNAIGLLDEIFHYIFRLYRNIEKDFFKNIFNDINNELKNSNLKGMDFLLNIFCENFPPEDVLKKRCTVKEWLNGNDSVSGIPNIYIAFEEFILLQITNLNPASKPFMLLFNDDSLSAFKEYRDFWNILRKNVLNYKPFGFEQTDIISFLQMPIKYSPDNLMEQLEYIKKNWNSLLKNIIIKILSAEDFFKEEKSNWSPPASGFEIPVYRFENLKNEYENFTTDSNWMPNVVLIAKSILVWLDQLSKKYGKKINRLDQIPDEEFSFFSEAGINAIWLIGIWQRSNASKNIKHIYGNTEAAASAYSIYDYEIAEELGGNFALEELRNKALKYGIRLAADMVPNHTGVDSKWIMEHPDFFLQCKTPPFPAYNFNTKNLSQNHIQIYLEKGYYNKTDCAVVFKRFDPDTNDIRFIYHGNDGTGLPWNDTAQIDFLNPNAREAVIQKILHVAKMFPIVRFDAAMVLTKMHIRRLWYPQIGKGGDIASRSSYCMDIDEFESKIPNEFWREVVDRCTKEAPNTLLMAEAFWMTEGFFVRTLGMHRVYNSAFMNMLKKEENAKYRKTIKNTIEFDPDILKRYVNFMNNPDEETAIVQFGSDDKYFGICTMMCTMPGLPMFGHGQLEGFAEKYGMEFTKAYKNETVNQTILQRHKSEIFPLLHKRYIFSGVENFRLFDFWDNDLINENVFAWSNFCGNKRSLIFYNNSLQTCAGKINISTSFINKNNKNVNTLIQNNLIEALQLHNDENYFTILKEFKSGLSYIRKNSELVQNGFFAILKGYEIQVFIDIYEIEDTEKKYLELYNRLNGKGIHDIEREIKKLTHKELYSLLNSCINKEYLINALELIQNKKNSYQEYTNLIDIFILEYEKSICNFLENIINYNFLYEQQEKKSLSKDEILKLKIYNMFKCKIKKIFLTAFYLNDKTQNYTNKDILFFMQTIQNKIFNTKENIILYFTFCMLYIFYDIIVEFTNENNAFYLIDYFDLTSELNDLLFKSELIKNKNIIKNYKALFKALNYYKKYSFKYLDKIDSHDAEYLIIGYSSQINEFIKDLFNDKNICKYLQVHDWAGVSFFNKEAFEDLAFYISVYEFIRKITNDKIDLNEINENILCCIKLMDTLFSIGINSEYKTNKIINHI